MSVFYNCAYVSLCLACVRTWVLAYLRNCLSARVCLCSFSFCCLFGFRYFHSAENGYRSFFPLVFLSRGTNPDLKSGHNYICKNKKKEGKNVTPQTPKLPHTKKPYPSRSRSTCVNGKHEELEVSFLFREVLGRDMLHRYSGFCFKPAWHLLLAGFETIQNQFHAYYSAEK